MATLQTYALKGSIPLRFIASLEPYVIVFTASACGLIIEIVAGRILAPSIGVSVYTWTSIIGVVLAGISLGNYLGGRIADLQGSQTLLGVILLAAGLSSLSVLPLVNLVSDAFGSLPIIPRIVLLTATLFFIPSCILGMVTPLVIKLRLRDLSKTGNVVGKVYAISTSGSILGTFLAGFVLIQWIGSRPILVLISLVLVAMALAFGRLWRARIMGPALLAAFGALAIFVLTGHGIASPCLRESNYFCIKVREETRDGNKVVKVLTLDKLVHSHVSLDDPTLLIYNYEQIFSELASFGGQRDPRLRTLSIGGGGYTLPRYLEVTYPQSTVEVIEIDPAVTEVAYEYLGLWADSRIVTFNEDARMVIPDLEERRYDIVYGDAFNDLSVPFHLTTVEFNEDVKALLKDDGMYAVNVVDKMRSGNFLRSFVHTMRRSFPYVYVLSDDEAWDNDLRDSYVVVGALRPLASEALRSASVSMGKSEPIIHFMPAELLQSWLGLKRNVLLTDDYVPVENMLAPLFLDR